MALLINAINLFNNEMSAFHDFAQDDLIISCCFSIADKNCKTREEKSGL